MNRKSPRPSTWVVARITLALAIVGVLGYRWHEDLLSWPLLLMTAFIAGLLMLEMFTADRRQVRRDFDDEGRPVPRRRAGDHQAVEVDTEDVTEPRVTTAPGIHH